MNRGDRPCSMAATLSVPFPSLDGHNGYLASSDGLFVSYASLWYPSSSIYLSRLNVLLDDTKPQRPPWPSDDLDEPSSALRQCCSLFFSPSLSICFSLSLSLIRCFDLVNRTVSIGDWYGLECSEPSDSGRFSEH